MNDTPLTVTSVANTGTGHVAYLESENKAVQVSIAYPRNTEGEVPFTEGEVHTLNLELAAEAPEPADTGTAAPGTAAP